MIRSFYFLFFNELFVEYVVHLLLYWPNLVLVWVFKEQQLKKDVHMIKLHIIIWVQDVHIIVKAIKEGCTYDKKGAGYACFIFWGPYGSYYSLSLFLFFQQFLSMPTFFYLFWCDLCPVKVITGHVRIRTRVHSWTRVEW